MYHWTVTESDGYSYSEAGYAYDILDAAVKAVEYDPSCVKTLMVAEVRNE